MKMENVFTQSSISWIVYNRTVGLWMKRDVKQKNRALWSNKFRKCGLNSFNMFFPFAMFMYFVTFIKKGYVTSLWLTLTNPLCIKHILEYCGKYLNIPKFKFQHMFLRKHRDGRSRGQTFLWLSSCRSLVTSFH